MLLYLTCLAWIFGTFLLWGLTFLTAIYFVLAYGTLLWALLACARSSRDWINPLTLVLALGFIRFSIPGFMIWLGLESGLAIFDLMGIRRQDWVMGHALALMGLLGVVTGWHLNLKLPPSAIRKIEALTGHFSKGLPVAAVLSMSVGLIALYLFVSSNASFQEAIYTGEMRGTEIQEGTGKYFRVALMLISSSVVFSIYLGKGGYAWWSAILPSAVAAGAFAVLGGRSLAFLPVAAAWFGLWCRNHTSKTSMRIALVLGVVLLPVYSYLGQVYRGGLGVEGVTAQIFSPSAVLQYLSYSVWLDWGHLHSMAAAVMIGPGVLGGQTFSVLLWPLSKILQLPARSAGVFMVDELLPDYGTVSRGKWGFHATLIGDAYLNFGSVGVIGATIIFGILLRILYGQIREQLSNTAFYGLALVCCLQILYISIQDMADAILILGFGIFVVQLGRFFNVPSVSPSGVAYEWRQRSK
jgi:oligosaccharide repeat unit polymerase